MTYLGDLTPIAQSNHSQSAILARWCQSPCSGHSLATVGIGYYRVTPPGLNSASGKSVNLTVVRILLRRVATLLSRSG